MKITKYFASIFILFFIAIPSGKAIVDLSLSELQASKNLLWPGGTYLNSLSRFSSFELAESKNTSKGISAIYESFMLDDPKEENELPHLALNVQVFSSQESAKTEFENLLSLAGKNSNISILNKDSYYIFYRTESGTKVNLLQSVDAEYYAYHLLHFNGSILIESSIYRPDEGTIISSAEAYAKAIKNTTNIYEILYDAVDTFKLSAGLLFQPTEYDINVKTEKYNLNLSENYSIPQNGYVELEVYIGEPEGASGTILDSSGLSIPEEGDIYLYINDDGKLFGGIYAPLFDSNCKQQKGWYRIETKNALQTYAWNKIKFSFGVGGLNIYMDGVNQTSCKVSQEYSGNDLYLGDFPKDSLNESMSSYVKNINVYQSKTSSGLIWDEVLENQLFLDLPNSDPDLPAFQYLKEKGIFLGSDGVLLPDTILNRAETVKILLKAYGYSSSDESASSFWDVPSTAWYLKYLNKAESIGLAKGHSDGRFLPAHSLNRAEFFTLLLRISGEKYKYEKVFKDVDSDEWYAEGAMFAYKNKIITSGKFYPTSKISRREAGKALYQLLK